jgi:hypothetical protein
MDDKELLERQVLWVTGHQDIGVRPGSFMGLLIAAVFQADRDNKSKLAAVYPGVVAACVDFSEGDLFNRYKAEGELWM